MSSRTWGRCTSPPLPGCRRSTPLRPPAASSGSRASCGRWWQMPRRPGRSSTSRRPRSPPHRPSRCPGPAGHAQARQLRRRAEQLRERRQRLEEERALLGKYREMLDAFSGLFEAGHLPPGVRAYHIVLRPGQASVVEPLRQALAEALDSAFELRTRTLSAGDTALLLLVPLPRTGRVERLLGRERGPGGPAARGLRARHGRPRRSPGCGPGSRPSRRCWRRSTASARPRQPWQRGRSPRCSPPPRTPSPVSRRWGTPPPPGPRSSSRAGCQRPTFRPSARRFASASARRSPSRSCP